MTASKSSKFRHLSRLVLSKWVVMLGLLWLTSCQNFPKSEVPIDAEDTKIYQGRIAFKSPDESFVSMFSWLESNANFRLTLRDRLALGGVRLLGNEENASVEFSNGQKEENIDLDQWIEDKLGISVPFLELWKCLSLQCKLIEEADQQEFDSHGRLETFSNNQWTFTLSYRESDPDSSTLRKLELRKGDTQIRIFFTKFLN